MSNVGIYILRIFFFLLARLEPWDAVAHGSGADGYVTGMLQSEIYLTMQL